MSIENGNDIRKLSIDARVGLVKVAKCLFLYLKQNTMNAKCRVFDKKRSKKWSSMRDWKKVLFEKANDIRKLSIDARVLRARVTRGAEINLFTSRIWWKNYGK